MAPAKVRGAVLTGAPVTTTEVIATIPTGAPAGEATPIPVELTRLKTEPFGRCIGTGRDLKDALLLLQVSREYFLTPLFLIFSSDSQIAYNFSVTF